MSKVESIVFAAALGGAALAFSVGPTSAAVVCSGDECWHAQETYHYPAEAHVVIHSDDWKWKDNEHFRWHEHPGRGFWAGGEWKEF